ncbi:hypothetical protein [Synechococcus sp. MIT S9509]|uniref:hypothetical protein n=1 Tax=unclassified Synechococcus TaxID=2626047 RepID=UPI0039B1201A
MLVRPLAVLLISEAEICSSERPLLPRSKTKWPSAERLRVPMPCRVVSFPMEISMPFTQARTSSPPMVLALWPVLDWSRFCRVPWN